MNTNIKYWDSSIVCTAIYPPTIHRRDDTTVWVTDAGKWYVAPNTITLDEVRKQWLYNTVKKHAPIIRIVESSNKLNTYTVIKDGMNISCNCPGYQFRRNCKHVKIFDNQ
jgi:hypothetical protein